MSRSYCAVPFCKNTNNKTKVPNCRYFPFPKNAFLRKEWLRACGRPNDSVHPSTRVCSFHFEATDYKSVPKKNDPTLEHTLKPYVVPHLNVPSLYSSKICVSETERITIEVSKEEYNDLLMIDKEPEVAAVQNKESGALVPEISDSLPGRKISIFRRQSSDPAPGYPDAKKSRPDSPKIYLESDEITIEEDPLRLPETDRQSLANKEQVVALANEVVRLKSRAASLENRNRKLTEQGTACRRDVARLEREAYVLRADLEKSKRREAEEKRKALEARADAEATLRKCFSPAQISLLRDRKRVKRVEWSQDDVAMALRIRQFSVRCYLYLRDELRFPLPSLATLERWEKQGGKKQMDPNGVLSPAITVKYETTEDGDEASEA